MFKVDLWVSLIKYEDLLILTSLYILFQIQLITEFTNAYLKLAQQIIS